MIRVMINIFIFSQLSIALIECFVDLNPEHSVQTCFTKNNRPAFCVDQTLCNKLDKSNLEPLENCANSDKVCCPLSDDGDYRDAFVVPSGLAWDWTQAWPNMPWATLRPPSSPKPPPSPIPVITINNATTPSITSPGSAPSAVNINQGCGARNIANVKDDDELGFIVGGEVAKPNSWPWAVAMNSSGRFVCGATIIDSRHVLCAAHCVSHSSKITKPDQIKLLIGAHNRYKSGEYYGVEKVIVHSGYDERKMQNDISIFRLDRPITFSKAVSPLCLPTNCEMCSDSNKQTAYLAGWGTTSAGGRVSDELREVAVPVIALKDCVRAYGDASMVTSKQICAGILGVGGKDSCQGDSGGFLSIKPQAKENKYFQCGIVSWGRGCADPKYPGVYTKVCEFMDWIRDKTRI